MKKTYISFLFLASLLLFSGKAFSKYCIAHRGFSGAYLENSLQALRAAYDAGTDGIEFDVLHTKDGVGIVLHNDTLKKTAISLPGKNCKLKTKIQDQTYLEIEQNCILKNGESVPTLKTVLREFFDKGIFIFLELKDIPSKETLELIKNIFMDRDEFLRIISLNNKALKKVQKYGFMTQKLSLFKPVIKRYKSYGLLSTKRNIKFLSKNKFETSVWTVNNPVKMKKAMDMGIKFITTDHPDICLEVKSLLI